MRPIFGVVIATAALSLTLPHIARAQTPPVRERLGGRLGYVLTDGGLNDSYGNAWNATLHFSEKAFGSFFVDIRLGAIYQGDLRRPEIAERFTGIPGIESAMRLLFISIGPQYLHSMGESWMGYGSAAFGIYSVSLLFDTGIQAVDISQQNLGGNASVGALWRLAGNWNIDLNITLHIFKTNKSRTDLFYIFTDGYSNPLLLQFAAGITIDLR